MQIHKAAWVTRTWLDDHSPSPPAPWLVLLSPPPELVPMPKLTPQFVTSPSPVLKPVVLHVNGRDYKMEVDTRRTLLDALREQCHLTGPKKGCDHGQCGACTVHIDGQRHLSCLTLTVAVPGHSITTIEGLASNGRLHPLQQAFIDHDAFQCGYCTSGQIMSGIACIHEGNAGTDADIREYMSGNLCRCAAYPNIVAAVRQAKQEMEKER